MKNALSQLLLLVLMAPVTLLAQAPITFIDITPPLEVAPTVYDYDTRGAVDFRDLTIGLTYQVRLQTVSEPTFSSVRGGRILSYSYENTSKVATYNIEFTDRSDTTIGTNQLFIEVLFDGSILPTFWNGGYVSTNNAGIGLIDPYEGHPAFGFVLYGQPGDTPFIELFISTQMLAAIDELYGSPVSLESMEFYSNDTKEQNTSIEAVSGGGALAKCSTTITSSTSSSIHTASQLAHTVTIEATKPTPTLSANKAKITKGNSIKLTASIEGCEAGTLVHLYRSAKRSDRYAKLKHKPTNSECKAIFSDKPSTKTYYYVIYDGEESEAVSVKVK